MNTIEILSLMPIITLSTLIVIILLFISFSRNHLWTLRITVLGLLITNYTLIDCASLVVSHGGSINVMGMLVIDNFSLFFMFLMLSSAIVVSILGYHYLQREAVQLFADHSNHLVECHEEFYILILLATLGASVIVASTHFASFFMGLELLGVSLYALIAFPANGYDRTYNGIELPLEAGMKYLILSAVSTTFMLFGIALIYAQFGTLEFAAISALSAQTPDPSLYSMVGATMLVIGLGFKLSLVPFHMWTPDVYQGAPTPVTAFLATVSKGSIIAILLRYFNIAGAYQFEEVLFVLAVIAVTSMVIGNLLALRQTNIKRILAYSSIAHVGYILVAFLAGVKADALTKSGQPNFVTEAIVYYIFAYFVTTLGAFAVINFISGSEGDNVCDKDGSYAVEQYRGLFWRNPWLATSFMLMLLSLAGIPLTVGFIGKFYIFAVGIQSKYWFLLLFVILGSAIGLYYYLRVVIVMFQNNEAPNMAKHEIPLSGNLTVTVLTAALVALGIYPMPLISAIQSL